MRWWWIFLCAPLCANPTVVRSDSAHYNGTLLTLRGHVYVQHEMGEIHAAQASLKRDAEKSTKLDFPWIRLEEGVRLQLPKERELLCHSIFCDYVEKRAYIEGGLHYSDIHGELSAQRGIIDYVEEERTLKPTKVTLLGGVEMRSCKHPQYALADHVDYFPDEERLVMTAENRVLFYDEEHGIELAAREVHARRDLEGKESVQGVGDVRFIFNAEELEKLQDMHVKSRKS